MKKILTLALVAIAAIACSKDDGVGSYAISGAPEITSLAAGYQRVVVTWEHNTSSDESNYSNIYWNGGNNSSGQVVTSSSGSSITLEITNLSEGEYTFYVQNVNTLKSQQSAESTPVTIYVYGDSFVKDLAQRTISSIDYLSGDDIEEGAYVTWSSFNNSDGAIGNMLYYYGQGGEDVEFFCPISDTKSLIPDAIVETELDYATLYCPEGCLDTLATSSITGETFPMSSDGIIRVASLEAMVPYFKMDDVHVLLQTGEYKITQFTASSFENLGPLPVEVNELNADGEWEGTGEAYIDENKFINSFFLAEGNNSTYDFGGSTVTIQTTAYDVSGFEAYPLRFTGNGNTIKNLLQIDDGEAHAIHPAGITNCVMDGADNTLESVEIRSTGSWPYGYGEIFGKGGGYVVQHFKHCALLIRGDRNYVKGCTLIHRAYGHGLFMQAGQDITIEDTYVEGQMKSTNQIIEELQDPTALGYGCLTVWGYDVTNIAGYTLSLNEDGIRTYRDGVTIIDGEPYGGRITNNVTVRRCKVKNMRAGISLTLGFGNKVVEDVEAYGCDRGFAIGSVGTLTRCYADCQYGPAYGVDYESDRDITVDITLMPSQSEEYIDGWLAGNGSKQVAFIRGNRHKVHFKADPSLVVPADNQLYIQMGGDNTSVGELYELVDPLNIDDSYSRNHVIINETAYPIFLGGRTSVITNPDVTHGSVGQSLAWNNRIASVGDVVVINTAYEDYLLSQQKAVYEELSVDDISQYESWLNLDLTGESTDRP